MSATFATHSLQISFPNLVRNAAGEYTARSVADDPIDAADLHLVQQTDGAFAAPKPEPFVVSGSVAGRSAASVQSALYSLPLGG